MAITTLLHCDDEAALVEATGYNRDELWEYLSLDDWDYALVVDGAAGEQLGWYFARMLTGSCSNVVFALPAKDGRGPLLVGMAYHS